MKKGAFPFLHWPQYLSGVFLGFRWRRLLNSTWAPSGIASTVEKRVNSSR
jgi:hypothetical protein